MLVILKMIRMQGDDRALNPAQESLPYAGPVQWYR